MATKFLRILSLHVTDLIIVAFLEGIKSKEDLARTVKELSPVPVRTNHNLVG